MTQFKSWEIEWTVKVSAPHGSFTEGSDPVEKKIVISVWAATADDALEILAEKLRVSYAD